MKTWIGDILKSKLTGELYTVSKINKMMAITLESKDTPNKGWFGDQESLEFLYEKAENQEGKL